MGYIAAMPSDLTLSDDEAAEATAAGLSGMRAQAIYRLQMGLFGLGAIVLMVGLANVVMERARESEASTVPEAVATVAPEEETPAKKDPLADAGVVPDIPQATKSPATGETAEDASAAPPSQP